MTIRYNYSFFYNDNFIKGGKYYKRTEQQDCRDRCGYPSHEIPFFCPLVYNDIEFFYDNINFYWQKVILSLISINSLKFYRKKWKFLSSISTLICFKFYCVGISKVCRSHSISTQKMVLIIYFFIKSVFHLPTRIW